MNPILLDFPESFTTDRLLIRCPRPGDGAPMNEAIHESAASLKPWLPFADPVPSVEESEENLRLARAQFIRREDLRLLVLDKASLRFLGSSGLSRMDWKVGRFEIGYWLRDSAVSRGYMTEAVNGIVRFADEHLCAQRIEIRCDDRNERSFSVAVRCGFRLEGVLRHNRLDTAGQLEDTRVYAKLKLADGSWGYPD